LEEQSGLPYIAVKALSKIKDFVNISAINYGRDAQQLDLYQTLM